MAKQVWKGGTMIYPVPAAIVTCGESPEEWNMLTVAWTGTICTNPPMCYISVRPERYSFPLIEKSGEFTINLTTKAMAKAVDWVGVRSGRDHDKWKATGLTPEKGNMVDSPCIKESPLGIECRVKQITHLGSHAMILADVLCLRADERFIDPTTDKFNLNEAELMAWCHGHYWSLGEDLGHFGFSVKKS